MTSPLDEVVLGEVAAFAADAMAAVLSVKLPDFTGMYADEHRHQSRMTVIEAALAVHTTWYERLEPNADTVRGSAWAAVDGALGELLDEAKASLARWVAEAKGELMSAMLAFATEQNASMAPADPEPDEVLVGVEEHTAEPIGDGVQEQPADLPPVLTQAAEAVRRPMPRKPPPQLVQAPPMTTRPWASAEARAPAPPEHTCAECRATFATGRGLRIHQGHTDHRGVAE